MSKSDFIPKSDHDFLIWVDHFISILDANTIGVTLTADELSTVKMKHIDFHAKIATASDASRHH